MLLSENVQLFCKDGNSTPVRYFNVLIPQNHTQAFSAIYETIVIFTSQITHRQQRQCSPFALWPYGQNIEFS